MTKCSRSFSAARNRGAGESADQAKGCQSGRRGRLERHRRLGWVLPGCGGQRTPSASLCLGAGGCGESAGRSELGATHLRLPPACGAARPRRGLERLPQGLPPGCHGSCSCHVSHPPLAGMATSGHRCGDRGWLLGFPLSPALIPVTLGGHNPGKRTLSPAGGNGRTQLVRACLRWGSLAPEHQGPRATVRGVSGWWGRGQAVMKVLVTPGCYCKQLCELKSPGGAVTAEPLGTLGAGSHLALAGCPEAPRKGTSPRGSRNAGPVASLRRTILFLLSPTDCPRLCFGDVPGGDRGEWPVPIQGSLREEGRWTLLFFCTWGCMAPPVLVLPREGAPVESLTDGVAG